MRLHRFFIKETIDPQTVGSDIRVSDRDLAHQIGRVFRLHAGDSVILFDGSGVDHVCEIVSTESSNDGVMTFRIVESRSVKHRAKRKVVLALSLIKKDNFEWVIQKATELGIEEFIPIISERSEKKGLNMERARKIMIEACEQSGRGDIPLMKEPITLEAFLSGEKRSIVTFHTDSETPGELITSKDPIFDSQSDIVVCVGPEGGWSQGEIESFKVKGARIAFFDIPILRAETAAISFVALFLIK